MGDDYNDLACSPYYVVCVIMLYSNQTVIIHSCILASYFHIFIFIHIDTSIDTCTYTVISCWIVQLAPYMWIYIYIKYNVLLLLVKWEFWPGVKGQHLFKQYKWRLLNFGERNILIIIYNCYTDTYTTDIVQCTVYVQSRAFIRAQHFDCILVYSIVFIYRLLMKLILIIQSITTGIHLRIWHSFRVS